MAVDRIDYVEIDNVHEIARLNRILSRHLRRELRHSETRTVGYPVGNFDAVVHFGPHDNGEPFWWATHSGDRSLWGNFFGHGVPRRNDVLDIDVQFNLPRGRFHRRLGGAFLRHVRTGVVVLAHRGIVTLGHGRLRRDELFREIDVTRCMAETRAGPTEFLFVAELGARDMVRRIADFSAELRRAARVIKPDGGRHTARWRGSPRPIRLRRHALSGLRAYFDEFAGTRRIKRRTSVVEYWHGDVVKSLQSRLGNFELLKNVEVDLIAVAPRRAFMFEVKTSTDSQSIYTAVGQLTCHAPFVGERTGRAALMKVLVVPSELPARFDDLLERKLGIRVLKFDRGNDGRITIRGLNEVMQRRA